MIAFLLVLLLSVIIPFCAATIGHCRHMECRARAPHPIVGVPGLWWWRMFQCGEFAFRWGWRAALVVTLVWVTL